MSVPWFTTARVYAAWAAVGPLVGVIIGAWLAARWQRKKWILENKASEYRGILDALNSYRLLLAEYHASYRGSISGVDVTERRDAQLALGRAQDAVSNAFADRIFTRLAVSQSDAGRDWSTHAAQKLPDKMANFWVEPKLLDSVHDKLVEASQDDLKLHDA
jgi:hypothetical protein